MASSIWNSLEEIDQQIAAFKGLLLKLATFKSWRQGETEYTRESVPEIRAHLAWLGEERARFLLGAGPRVQSFIPYRGRR